MKRPNLNRKKIVLIVLAVLFIGVAVLVWLGQMKAKNKEAYYSGTIEAVQSELSFQVTGRVVAVNVKEGQQVQKDQVLAKLDDSDYRSKLDQARANLDKAVAYVLERVVGKA